MKETVTFKLHRLLLLFLLASVASCEPDVVSVHLLSYDLQSDRYVFQVEEITTLENISRLEGRATRLIAGTRLTLDYEKGEIRWQSVGSPVAMGYIRHRGVIYPEDYASMVMAAAYRNIELSMRFFEDSGMPQNLLPPLDTYYEAGIRIVDTAYGDEKKKHLEKDNVFYLPINERDRGFYVLPFSLFQTLPLAVNTGIMAHEYTHAVFDQLVYTPLKGAFYSQWPLYNELSALNEGVADAFAVLITGDPRFMRHSITPEWQRDASKEILYNAAWDLDVRFASPEFFNPYAIGEFLSALVYEVARQCDGRAQGRLSHDVRHEVGRMLYGALAQFGAQKSMGEGRIAAFIDLFVQQMNPAQTRTACDVLQRRYTAYMHQVTTCQSP